MDNHLNRFDETYYQRIERIFSNYTECVSKLNEIFGMFFDDVCGRCVSGEFGSDKTGIGCCKNSTPYHRVFGPAKDKIHIEREKLKTELMEDGRNMAEEGCCEFFEIDNGCILGDLKSARCASYFCITHI